MDQFVRLNDFQLHYLDHPGDDPPLVLMPGLTANAHSFDGLIKAGLSSAMRVLALDLRGRGLSDKPDSGYSLAEGHYVEVPSNHMTMLFGEGAQQMVEAIIAFVRQ